MITSHDYELTEAALASAGGNSTKATFILHNECGWTIAKARAMLRLVLAAEGKRL